MERSANSRAAGLAGRVLVGAVTVGALLSATLAPSAAAGGAGQHPDAVWPVDPHPVVSPFDPPSCTYCAGHRGVDLGGLPLTVVRAAIGGTVTYAGVLAGRGVLVIDDGSRRVTYEPVAPTVDRGDLVSPGEVVGRLEIVGSHCFPDACLHLGLIEDAADSYLDPLTLFGGAPGPVRLLPLWSDQPRWLSRVWNWL